MEDIIKEIEIALDNGLYLLALQCCIILPDICAALESENGENNPNKYKNWYNKYIGDKLSGNLSADDCYNFRCTIVHQAKAFSNSKKNPSYSRIVFSLPNRQNTMLHDNILGDVLNLDLVYFCRGMIKIVKAWKLQMEETENDFYQKNCKSMIRFYPNGVSGYVMGIPCIG